VLSLYLLRHGETEFSRGDRFCGDIDAPLTDVGHVMAQQFADAYDDLHWRGIITSTRRRTIATAAPLAARLGLRPRRDGRLDEMFFGDWQGLTKKEAAVRDPGRYGRWRKDPMVGAPSGESPFEVSVRALAAIDDLRARYEAGNVLVVSHKTVLRLLLCRLLNIDLSRYRECVNWPTGAVSVLELGPCHAAARWIADERHLSPRLLPKPRRHLVREQDAGWGEPEARLVDSDPSGGDGAADLDVAARDGIDAMTGAMDGAVDPGAGS
jgi:broad specificity phosphatase PhoE